MAISIFLAKVFGLYFLVISLTLLFRRKSFLSNVNAMMDSRPAMYLSAIMTLIMGILLVVAHNVWVFAWPVVVTIFCWLTFIKGVLRTAFPECDERWKGIYDKKNVTIIAGLFTLIFAIYFLVMGFCA